MEKKRSGHHPLAETFDAFETLKKARKIKAYGVQPAAMGAAAPDGQSWAGVAIPPVAPFALS